MHATINLSIKETMLIVWRVVCQLKNDVTQHNCAVYRTENRIKTKLYDNHSLLIQKDKSS